MSGDRSVISSVSQGHPVNRFAAVAVVTLVVGEIVLRWGGVEVLAGVVGSARGADVILIGIGFPLLAYGIARWGKRLGIRSSDWNYEVSVRSVGMGFASAIVFFIVYGAIATAYMQIVGTPQSSSVGAAMAEGVGETLWIAVGFLFVNGVIVPITEELAWRGVIQTSLMESYGTYAGGAITAVVFVLKHLIVDGSAPFLRVVSLVILAFVFCGLRARYGTASSTVAHIAANGIASAAVVSVGL